MRLKTLVELKQHKQTQISTTSNVEEAASNLYSDGFYIAELINPLHNKQRITVQILKGGFVGNSTFSYRTQKDGLASCYKLWAKINLDNLTVAPLLFN